MQLSLQYNRKTELETLKKKFDPVVTKLPCGPKKEWRLAWFIDTSINIYMYILGVSNSVSWYSVVRKDLWFFMEIPNVHNIFILCFNSMPATLLLVMWVESHPLHIHVHVLLGLYKQVHIIWAA